MDMLGRKMDPKSMNPPQSQCTSYENSIKKQSTSPEHLWIFRIANPVPTNIVTTYTHTHILTHVRMRARTHAHTHKQKTHTNTHTHSDTLTHTTHTKGGAFQGRGRGEVNLPLFKML